MAERDFEIGGRKFKLNRIDALKQFHLVRRLGPILGDILPVAQKLSKLKTDKVSQDEAFEAIVNTGGVTKIMEGFSNLSDEDANKVLIGLCSSVEMQQEHGNWARVAVADQLAFHDLELPVILQIAGRAFVYNIAGFFPSALPASRAG